MTTQEAIKIIDAHCQKYKKSCSPSIIEMLLKLEGKVPSDFYELQDFHKNNNVGLDFAHEKKIHGLTFHQHNATKEGPFAERIKTELDAGRFVGIYALNDDSTTDYHGWVVVELKKDGQLILRSKYSECGQGEGHITAPNDGHHISKTIPPLITDCVFYTID